MGSIQTRSVGPTCFSLREKVQAAVLGAHPSAPHTPPLPSPAPLGDRDSSTRVQLHLAGCQTGERHVLTLLRPRSAIRFSGPV